MKIKYFRKVFPRYVFIALIFTLVISMAACTSKQSEVSGTENPVVQNTPVPTQETQPTVGEPADSQRNTQPPAEATVKPTGEPTTVQTAEPTTDPTAEPGSEETDSGTENNKVEAWQQGYTDYIKNWKNNNTQSIERFALYDIDGDSIPELIIKPVPGSQAKEGLVLISYRDDGIIELGSYMASDRSEIEIYPEMSGFEFSGAKDNAVYIDAYVLQNYEIKIAYSYRYSNDTGSSPRAFYYVGEGQASKDEYSGVVNDFKRGGTVNLNYLSMSNADMAAVETIIKDNTYVWGSPAKADEYVLPDVDTIVVTEPVEVSDTGQPGNNSTAAPETANAGEYVLPDSDKRLLTEADLEGLSKEQLRIARNELYARNGRLFTSADLQTYFGGKSWYNGTIKPDDFNDSMLNEIEKKNLQLIQKAEQQQ